MLFQPLWTYLWLAYKCDLLNFLFFQKKNFFGFAIWWSCITSSLSLSDVVVFIFDLLSFFLKCPKPPNLVDPPVIFLTISNIFLKTLNYFIFVGLLLRIPPWSGLDEFLRPVGPALRDEGSCFSINYFLWVNKTFFFFWNFFKCFFKRHFILKIKNYNIFLVKIQWWGNHSSILIFLYFKYLLEMTKFFINSSQIKDI